jgi:hypothetical protein
MLLPANQQNVASMFQSEGYATGVCGEMAPRLRGRAGRLAKQFDAGTPRTRIRLLFRLSDQFEQPAFVYIENHQLIHPEDPLDKTAEAEQKSPV